MGIYCKFTSYLIVGSFIRATVLLLLTLILATHVNAEDGDFFFSADSLVEVCGTEEAQEYAICPAYIRGVLDGIEITQQTICVGYDVTGHELAMRIFRAALQFTVEGLADEILLGLPDRDLTKVHAADFVRWAFISTFEGENPTDFRCSN
jgi:hypothetical protein